MVKVTSEPLEENQLLLNVEVEPELVESSLDRAYRRLASKANIPGFRRGKVPRFMLERFIGREAVLEEALQDLLPDLYNRAIQEQGIEAIAQPRLEVVQETPLVFKAVVPLRPKVELSDYHQIRVEPQPAEVSAEAVESFLEQLRWDVAPWEPTEGPVKMGDLLTLDLLGKEDGRTVVEQKGGRYLVAATADDPAPGLADHLVGLKKGESKTFQVAYPPDYTDESWAGRELDFEARVLEVKEKRLSPLDDELAKSIGEGFESLEALRQHVRDRLEEQAQREARNNLEEQVVQAVVAGAQVDFPPIMVEQELGNMLEDLKARIRAQGITFEQYLRFINKTQDELVEEWLPTARERIKRRLVLDQVAQAEAITVEPAEVEGEIERAVAEAGPRGEELRAVLNSDRGRSSLERVLRTRKAVQRLVEIATAAEPAAEATATEAAIDAEGGERG
jgi:trigger factor